MWNSAFHQNCFQHRMRLRKERGNKALFDKKNAPTHICIVQLVLSFLRLQFLHEPIIIVPQGVNEVAECLGSPSGQDLQDPASLGLVCVLKAKYLAFRVKNKNVVDGESLRGTKE